ncbi:hypothetical protein PPERSA_11056 [Pseudocohnilembus persalinus]|uniref:folate gamma-glutamyl hydrolase n=1 Tax=Pseudocohnilembus persalinus TaxID=266149 RepID=A0A0V0QYX8_PSEPJ|nr:hypothetical protein PPERSA_11056 [Pseudocohnilembus persalinus]|eukprot:KRX07507.1 hypothetical protein PPERSA_11056 [Pseudocohnilembus persalinus]
MTIGIEQQKKKPVIGIYTQPAHFGSYQSDKYQYILQSNINFIKMAGGDVVAIPYNGSEEQLRKLFKGINGILFTGGGLDLGFDSPIENSGVEYNIFTKNAGFLMDLAEKANDSGDFFPIWGNCQGFELMQIIKAGNDHNILQNIKNNENVTRKTVLEQRSKLYQNMKQELIDYVQEENALFYYHEWAVYPQKFNEYKGVQEYFNVTGYSSNQENAMEGDVFVASIEAKNYPFYGLQYHPEYTLYDNNKNVNKSEKSLEFSRFFGEFFMEQARKNNHKFEEKNTEVLEKCKEENFEYVYFPEGFFQEIQFIKNSQLE